MVIVCPDFTMLQVMKNFGWMQGLFRSTIKFILASMAAEHCVFLPDGKLVCQNTIVKIGSRRTTEALAMY